MIGPSWFWSPLYPSTCYLPSWFRFTLRNSFRLSKLSKGIKVLIAVENLFDFVQLFRDWINVKRAFLGCGKFPPPILASLTSCISGKHKGFPNYGLSQCTQVRDQDSRVNFPQKSRKVIKVSHFNWKLNIVRNWKTNFYAFFFPGFRFSQPVWMNLPAGILENECNLWLIIFSKNNSEFSRSPDFSNILLSFKECHVLLW